MYDLLGFASCYALLAERCTTDIGNYCGCWCADGSTVTVTYSGGQIQYECPPKEV